MGFLDFIATNAIRSITLEPAKIEAVHSGIETAAAGIVQSSPPAVEEGVEVFSADDTPIDLQSPPDGGFAPSGSFFEPVKYFGNFRLFDSAFTPVNSYLEDSSFPYAKEIENLTPTLSDFVFDFGTIREAPLPLSTKNPELLQQLAVEEAPIQDAAVQDSVIQDAAVQKASSPVLQNVAFSVFQPSAGLTGLSGENAVSNRFADLSSGIDDLMKRAANLDLSTAEGQKELAQIQLQFSQAQRLMTALSEMMKKFNDLQERLIQNLGG